MGIEFSMSELSESFSPGAGVSAAELFKSITATDASPFRFDDRKAQTFLPSILVNDSVHSEEFFFVTAKPDPNFSDDGTFYPKRSDQQVDTIPLAGLKVLPKDAVTINENTALSSFSDGGSLTWKRINNTWKPSELFLTKARVTCSYTYNDAGDLHEIVTKDSSGNEIRRISRGDNGWNLYVPKLSNLKPFFTTPIDSLEIRTDGSWLLLNKAKSNPQEISVELNGAGEIVCERQIKDLSGQILKLKRIDGTTDHVRTYCLLGDGTHRIYRQLLPDRTELEYSYTDIAGGASEKSRFSPTKVVYSLDNTTKISFDWLKDQQCWAASGVYLGDKITVQKGRLRFDANHLPVFESFDKEAIDLSLEKLCRRTPKKTTVNQLQDTLLDIIPALHEHELMQCSMKIEQSYKERIAQKPELKDKLEKEKLSALKTLEAEVIQKKNELMKKVRDEIQAVRKMQDGASFEKIRSQIPATLKAARDLTAWLEKVAVPNALEAYKKPLDIKLDAFSNSREQAAGQGFQLTTLQIEKCISDYKSKGSTLGIDFSRPLTNESLELLLKTYHWTDRVIASSREFDVRRVYRETMPGLLSDLRFSFDFRQEILKNPADNSMMYAVYHLTNLYSTADALSCVFDIKDTKLRSTFQGPNAIKTPPGWDKTTGRIKFPENMCLSDPELQQFIKDLCNWISLEGPRIRNLSNQLKTALDGRIDKQMHYGDLQAALYAKFEGKTLVLISQDPIPDAVPVNLVSGDYFVIESGGQYYFETDWSARDSKLYNVMDIGASTINNPKRAFISGPDGKPMAFDPKDPVVYRDSEFQIQVSTADRMSMLRRKAQLNHYFSKASIAFLDGSMLMAGMFSCGSLAIAGAGLKSLLIPGARALVGLSGFGLNGAYLGSTETGQDLQKVRHFAIGLDVTKNLLFGHSAGVSLLEKLGWSVMRSRNTWYGAAARNWKGLTDSRGYRVFDGIVSAEFIGSFLLHEFQRRPGIDTKRLDEITKRIETAEISVDAIDDVGRKNQLSKVALLALFDSHTDRLSNLGRLSDSERREIESLRLKMETFLTVPIEIATSAPEAQKKWKADMSVKRQEFVDSLMRRLEITRSTMPFGGGIAGGSSNLNPELQLAQATAIYILSLDHDGKPPADGIIAKSSDGRYSIEADSYFRMLEVYSASSLNSVSLGAADMLVQLGKRPDFFIASVLKKALARDGIDGLNKLQRADVVCELILVMKRLEHFQREVLPTLDSSASVAYLSQGVGVRAHEILDLLNGIVKDRSLDENLRVFIALVLHSSASANSEDELISGLENQLKSFREQNHSFAKFGLEKLLITVDSLELPLSDRLSAVDALSKLEDLGPYFGSDGTLRRNETLMRLIELGTRFDVRRLDTKTLVAAIDLLIINKETSKEGKRRLTHLLTQRTIPEEVRAAIARRAFELIVDDQSKRTIVNTLTSLIAYDGEDSSRSRAKSPELRIAAINSLSRIGNAYPNNAIDQALIRVSETRIDKDDLSLYEESAGVRKAAIEALARMQQTEDVTRALKDRAAHDPDIAVRNLSASIVWSNFVPFEDEQRRLQTELLAKKYLQSEQFSYETAGADLLATVELPPPIIEVEKKYLKTDCGLFIPFKENQAYHRYVFDGRGQPMEFELVTRKELKLNKRRSEIIDKMLFAPTRQIADDASRDKALAALACLIRRADKPIEQKPATPVTSGTFHNALSSYALPLIVERERKSIEDRAIDVMASIAESKDALDKDLIKVMSIVLDDQVDPLVRLRLLKSLKDGARKSDNQGRAFDRSLSFGVFLVDALDKEFESLNQDNQKWQESRKELRMHILESIREFKPICYYDILSTLQVKLALMPNDPVCIRAMEILADLRHSIEKRYEAYREDRLLLPFEQFSDDLISLVKLPVVAHHTIVGLKGVTINLGQTDAHATLAARILTAKNSRNPKDTIVAVDAVIAATKFGPIVDPQDPRLSVIRSLLEEGRSKPLVSYTRAEPVKVAEHDKDLLSLAGCKAALTRLNSAFSDSDRRAAAAITFGIMCYGREYGHRRDAKVILEKALHHRAAVEGMIDYALSESPQRRETWQEVEKLLNRANFSEHTLWRRADGTSVVLHKRDDRWVASELFNGALRSYRAPESMSMRDVWTTAPYGIADPQFRFECAKEIVEHGTNAREVEAALYVISGLTSSKNMPVRIKACRILASYCEGSGENRVGLDGLDGLSRDEIQKRFKPHLRVALEKLFEVDEPATKRILTECIPTKAQAMLGQMQKQKFESQANLKESTNRAVVRGELLTQLSLSDLRSQLDTELNRTIPDIRSRDSYRQSVERELSRCKSESDRCAFLVNVIQTLRLGMQASSPQGR